MKRNFVPHPSMPGEGRCRVCDLPYSKDIAAEVRRHRLFHRAYLLACDGVGAPAPEAVRDRWREEGLALQFLEGATFEERLAGAERWLVAQHHEHLFRALLYGVNRLALSEFISRHAEERGWLASFGCDVATALLSRYTDSLKAKPHGSV